MTELTGRRRYRLVDVNAYSRIASGEHNVLVLQVEYTLFGKVDAKWCCHWRDATPEDLTTETIVGLPDQRG